MSFLIQALSCSMSLMETPKLASSLVSSAIPVCLALFNGNGNTFHLILEKKNDALGAGLTLEGKEREIHIAKQSACLLVCGLTSTHGAL